MLTRSELTAGAKAFTMKKSFTGDAMTSVISEAKKVLAKMPKGSTWEDIQYEFYVRAKVEKGIQEIKAGKGVPHEQVVREMRKWRAK